MEVQILSPRLSTPRITSLRQIPSDPEEKSFLPDEQSDVKPEKWDGRVFAMFVMFGIASLTPWNMFITATSYFEAKFNGSSTAIQNNFPNYFQTGAICVDVIVSFLAVYLVREFSPAKLVYVANFIMLSMFAVTSVLARIESSSWALEFFILTEVLFCIMCGGGALYISTMWAITSAMNSIYTEAFLWGMSTAGIIASVLNIITLSIPGIDFVGAGFWYFIAAIIILLISLGLFYQFQRHYYQESDPFDSSEFSISSLKSPLSKLIRDTLPQGYCCFCVLFITFIMFPGVLSSLESTASPQSLWASRYFLPVSLFLVFNVGDLIGRLTARVIEFPGRALIPWYTTGRGVFVLLMLMCNLQPRSLSLWFADDVTPTVLVFLFAATSGQVLTLCLRFAPEASEDKMDKQTIGTIMGVHGALGRVLGSLSTYIIFMVLK